MPSSLQNPGEQFPTARFGAVSGGNYAEFQSDGSLVMYGNARNWDDLLVPLTQVRQGALLKPDFDYTNVGLLFPQNNATEIAYIIAQFSHRRASGVNAYPHIHWQQMNSNAVVWKMAYKWFDNGGAVPGSFTTITATVPTDNLFMYTSGNLAQITDIPAIDGSSITGLSSMMLIKLYREDNVDGGAGGGDAMAFQFDIHFEIDMPGSRQEYVK